MKQTEHLHQWGFDSFFTLPRTVSDGGVLWYRADYRFRCIPCWRQGPKVHTSRVVRVKLKRKWEYTDVGVNMLLAHRDLEPSA